MTLRDNFFTNRTEQNLEVCHALRKSLGDGYSAVLIVVRVQFGSTTVEKNMAKPSKIT